MERLPNCPETCRLIRHLVIKLAPVILGEKPAGLLLAYHMAGHM